MPTFLIHTLCFWREVLARGSVSVSGVRLRQEEVLSISNMAVGDDLHFHV